MAWVAGGGQIVSSDVQPSPPAHLVACHGDGDQDAGKVKQPLIAHRYLLAVWPKRR
jgi:hypothetical protein